MSELTYKKIVDVEQVETLNDAATVFINDNGAMKQVAADKFGAVKTVNGVVPDENGDVFTEDLADIRIVDMTDVVPGRISMNYGNKSYSEILDMLSRNGSNVRGAIVARTCLLKTGEQIVYTATAYDPYALHKMRIHFGDNICPLIIDAEANTITLDPDWTKPEENAGGSGGVFVVNITFDENNSFTADKTFEEVESAIREGSLVFARMYVDYGDGEEFATQFPMTEYSGDLGYAFFTDTHNLGGAFVMNQIGLRRDGTISNSSNRMNWTTTT